MSWETHNDSGANSFEQGLIDYADKGVGMNEAKLKEHFWEVVYLIMNHFYKHPNPLVRQGIKQLEDDAAQQRATSHNKYGATKDLSIRKVCLLPDRLILALDKLYNKDYPITASEFKEGFWKRYPKFRTAEVY